MKIKKKTSISMQSCACLRKGHSRSLLKCNFIAEINLKEPAVDVLPRLGTKIISLIILFQSIAPVIIMPLMEKKGKSCKILHPNKYSVQYLNQVFFDGHTFSSEILRDNFCDKLHVCA